VEGQTPYKAEEETTLKQEEPNVGEWKTWRKSTVEQRNDRC
jgi:hypothetical protein